MFDINKIRREFPIINDIIYLDNAATSQKPLCVIDTISNYLKHTSNYGRGVYKRSLEITDECDLSRIVIGKFFNVSPMNIIFTKSTTDGINIVVNGLKLKKTDHIIISSIEHNSNLIPWFILERKGVEITILNSDLSGIISVDSIIKNIKQTTKLLAITHISNFYGTKQKIEEIIKICHDFNIKVLIDGAQSAGHISIDLKRINCDIFVTSGHKGLLGPQGIGILYLKDPSIINVNSFGGGNIEYLKYPIIKLKKFPYCFECGTPNILGILGLKTSIEYINKIGILNIEKYEYSITNYCYNKLKEINEVEIYGDSNNKINLLSFNIKNIDPNTIALFLSRNNICIRSGYHCAHHIHNILNIDGSLRVSIGLYNTKDEINYLIDSLNEIITNIL